MNLRTLLTIIPVALVSLACQSVITSHRTPPFGTDHEIAFATSLWNRMAEEGLVGEQQKKLEPFFGGAPPHGMILEVTHQMLTIDEHHGFLVLKKNYDGPDVSIESVIENREKFLSSVTIMYQREPGYDRDNQDWFWVKYKPDGQLFEKDINGMRLAMAGRILKGKTAEDSGGCIYCHSSAGGGDYIFYPEIEKPASN